MTADEAVELAEAQIETARHSASPSFAFTPASPSEVLERWRRSPSGRRRARDGGPGPQTPDHPAVAGAARVPRTPRARQRSRSRSTSASRCARFRRLHRRPPPGRDGAGGPRRADRPVGERRADAPSCSRRSRRLALRRRRSTRRARDSCASGGRSPSRGHRSCCGRLRAREVLGARRRRRRPDGDGQPSCLGAHRGRLRRASSPPSGAERVGRRRRGRRVRARRATQHAAARSVHADADSVPACMSSDRGTKVTISRTQGGSRSEGQADIRVRVGRGSRGPALRRRRSAGVGVAATTRRAGHVTMKFLAQSNGQGNPQLQAILDRFQQLNPTSRSTRPTCRSGRRTRTPCARSCRAVTRQTSST